MTWTQVFIDKNRFKKFAVSSTCRRIDLTAIPKQLLTKKREHIKSFEVISRIERVEVFNNKSPTTLEESE